MWKARGIFNLGGLLKIAQGEDEPGFVDQDGDGVAALRRDASEPKILLEKLPGSSDVWNSEIYMIQPHDQVLHENIS